MYGKLKFWSMHSQKYYVLKAYVKSYISSDSIQYNIYNLKVSLSTQIINRYFENSITTLPLLSLLKYSSTKLPFYLTALVSIVS